MKQNLHKAFKNMAEINPPSHLEGAIFRKIEQEKIRQIKRKLIFSHFGLVFSISAMLYFGIFLGGSFLKSDFWTLASLIFSDIFVVSQYWKDFFFSLLENFPFIHFIFILLPIFTLLLSIDSYIKLRGKNVYQWGIFGKKLLV